MDNKNTIHNRYSPPTADLAHQGVSAMQPCLSTIRRFFLGLSIAVMCSSCMHSQMVVESLTGPVTKAETDSLLNYVSGRTPDVDNQGNHWSYGPSGQIVRAAGLVYEIDHDVRLLDQMIRFCDALASERNDLAPAPLGQHRIWTGRIDPVWPNSLTGDLLQTGGEQGDMGGDLAYCAALILKTQSLWPKSVPDSDQHHYGKTYLARAKTYIAFADASIDGHILKSLLDLSHDNHQYFSVSSPYKGGTPVPWNQQMMFNYGFEYMAIAHRILADDPARTHKYHNIVAASLDWFFTAGQQTISEPSGRSAYDWGYALPSKSGEDATHAAMDVAGFYSAFTLGDYNLTFAQMEPFANTLLDVMTLGSGFAGRVNGTSEAGHAAKTTSLRSGYLLLAEFRPDAYLALVSVDFAKGGSTDKVDLFSRFLWIKHRRNQTRHLVTAKSRRRTW